MADDYIEKVKNTPSIWDSNHEDYGKPIKRRGIFKSWIPYFKEKYNITFTVFDLQSNYTVMRVEYRGIMDKPDKNITKESVIFREKVKFLEFKEPYNRKCDYCDQVFKAENLYKVHLLTTHNNSGKHPFQCEHCGKTLNTYESYKSHLIRVHTEKVRLPCPYCHFDFGNKDILQKHIQTCHSDPNKTTDHVCKTCGKQLSNKYLLKIHENKHINKRDFACHLCPKAFYTKCQLQDHINTHLDIRKHKCLHCDKAFHSNYALCRHRQLHETFKRFICLLCDARFPQFFGLNYHVKHKHSTVPNKVNSLRLTKRQVENGDPEKIIQEHRAQLHGITPSSNVSIEIKMLDSD